MKFAFGILLCFFASSSFAQSVSEAVASIEAEKDVKCKFLRNNIGMCFGTYQVFDISSCRYSKVYSCYGAESFKLKVKVKEYFNINTNAREAVVIGTTLKY